MATATLSNTVEAKPREATDKNAARRVRTTGMIPAVIYGAGKDPRPVSVDPKQIDRILHSASGHNTIIDVVVDNQPAKAMIVDWQNDPIKGNLLHVDIKRIAMDKKMRIEVPIHVVGDAPGVKVEGGILDVVMREVEIECFPGDIPEAINVDVTGLHMHGVVRVSELPKSDKIKYVSDEDLTVVHVTAIKEVAEPTADAAAAEAAAGPAEPEVIKKGKPEEEAEKSEKKK
jgi:large subunit ribosomal protein L25